MQNNREFAIHKIDHEPQAERDIRRIVEDIHRLNYSIQMAVEHGASIELVRTSRHHNGNGSWGDQMAPKIRLD